MSKKVKILLFILLCLPLLYCIFNNVKQILKKIKTLETRSLSITQIHENTLESDICSDALLSKSLYYKELMSRYLDAWYKFVPHQSSMNSNNCWYVENFNSLPVNLTKKMKELPNIQYLQTRFTKADIELILKNIFRRGNSAVSTARHTSHHFCLPNTKLIGFTKTGSTLLYDYIRSHPKFAEPYSKESLFWREVMTLKDTMYIEFAVLLYLYHFLDASDQLKENPLSTATIDASISVIFATLQPLEIAEIDVCIVPLMLFKTMPNSKLLVQMRNPVDRLWSDFLFYCPPDKWDEQDATKALEKTSSVVASVFHNYTLTAVREFTSCIASGHTLIHCTALAGSYPGRSVGCEKVRLGISMYYVHLVKWFSVFPRDQIHVLRLEDLVSDSHATMNKVWSFLGMNTKGYNDSVINSKVNANLWVQTSDGEEFKMFPETRKILSDFFNPYNAKLAKLLSDKSYLWTEN